jgi:hypothetical protein
MATFDLEADGEIKRLNGNHQALAVDMIRVMRGRFRLSIAFGGKLMSSMMSLSWKALFVGPAKVRKRRQVSADDIPCDSRCKLT